MSSPCRRGKQPRVGELVSSWDYNGQPYLYHWTAKAALPGIVKNGLIPGCRPNYPDVADNNPRYREQVWFSAQDDRWSTASVDDAILLRVVTCRVTCFYDSHEWLYDDDGDADIYGDRLSDCVTFAPIPPQFLSVRGNDPQSQWFTLTTMDVRRLMAEVGSK